MLEGYCEFISSSAHYVVEQAIRYTFRKDKEFQEWFAVHGTTGRKKKAETAASETESRQARTGAQA